MKLNLEQLAYLKSLDSKKKKRKFLLDCLVESIEVEENPIVTTEEFLKYIGREDLIDKKVSEQGSELLKFDILEKESKVDLAIKKFTCFRDEIIEKIVSFESNNKGVKVVFDEKKFFSIIDADEVKSNKNAN